jgi:rhamnogalacturonan endolyase
MITLMLLTTSAATAGVTFTDLGSQVKLDNGIVSATWTKATIEMTSLKHRGDELLGNGGKGYIQQNFDDSYLNPSGATYALETNEPGFKDISFTWIVSGMEMELHYAMGENDSGIYSYVIADYDFNRAGKSEMQQFNLALRSDPKIFTRAYVEDDRIYDMPAAEEVAAGTTLSPKEAILLADGTIHYKYLYSNYIKYLDVHGWTGNGKGLWIISASNEYVNGGPTHQELTVHQTATTPVTLKHFSAAHYGAGTTSLGSDDSPWRKLYGPYMIYLNADAEDADAMWVDAKSRAAREIAAWPYSWMDQPLYPVAAGRGTVSGTLNITDGSSPAGALVILAQPTDGTAETNWQRQGKDYI